MADLKVGDRVYHDRPGRRREYGTVARACGTAGDNGRMWFEVRWDSGAICLRLAGQLNVERQKAR